MGAQINSRFALLTTEHMARPCIKLGLVMFNECTGEATIFEMGGTQHCILVDRFTKINAMSLYKSNPLCSYNRIRWKLMHRYSLCIAAIPASCLIWGASDATSPARRFPFLFSHIACE